MRRKIRIITLLLLCSILFSLGCNSSQNVTETQIPTHKTPTPIVIPTVKIITHYVFTPTPVKNTSGTSVPIKNQKLVIVKGTGGENLNIREKPNSGSKIVAIACEGTILLTEGNPVIADNYVWLKISGYGYAVDDFLTSVSAGTKTTKEVMQGEIKYICPN